MERKSVMPKHFGLATLVMFIWFIVAVIYYCASLLNYSMVDVGMWVWLVASIGTVFVLWKISKQWLAVWLVLKISVLKVVIFIWHLFVFLVTQGIHFNLIVGILFSIYGVHRTKELSLKGLDIIAEMNMIFKANSNALYMTSIFYLWYAIRTTVIVEYVMLMLNMDYIVAMITTICLFIVAVFGYVRVQYVLCVNITHWMLKKQGRL